MRNRLRKKSQMEILGLLIIIILFSLGLMFGVRYVILKEPDDTKEAFIQAQLSSNTLSAFLKTNNPNCKGADMTELFRDCGYYPSIDCDYDGNTINPDITINPKGLEDSCFQLHQSLKQVFGATLDYWKIDYKFTVTTSAGDKLAWANDIKYGECGVFAEGKPQTFTIPTDYGDLNLELKIC